MYKFLILIVYISAASARKQKLDPISDQIAVFKEQAKGPVGIMTTQSGAPIESRDAGSTLNTDLLRNEFFMETLSHFVRERIPVRSVHPKGAGAFGYFITTRDISDKCKADFLNEIGKVTPVAVRFSTIMTDRGGSDLTREAKGFAVKFYTEEGNFDVVGFNTPVFGLKDPNLFVKTAHVLRTNPVTDFPDPNMLWDFLTSVPESLYEFIILLSDIGISDGYNHLPGFSIHTYPLYNAAGKISYARFQFYPVSGLKTLNSTVAASRGATDPNYNARQLYEAIAKGSYPSWDVNLQMLSEEQVKNATFDVFDVTKRIPESLAPWKTIGRLVLNRLSKNYFADVEQMAFCPSNLVPGILGAPDKVFEARSLFYRDSQRYRLGPNFDKIEVNCPYRSKVLTYSRDGTPPVKNNQDGIPNYYPNSFNGPVPYTDKFRPSVPKIYERKPDNFAQASDYYENEIIGDERNRLVENIVASLSGVVNFIQDRAVKIFTKINQDLGQRVAKSLKKAKNNPKNRI